MTFEVIVFLVRSIYLLGYLQSLLCLFFYSLHPPFSQMKERNIHIFRLLVVIDSFSDEKIAKLDVNYQRIIRRQQPFFPPCIITLLDQMKTSTNGISNCAIHYQENRMKKNRFNRRIKAQTTFTSLCLFHALRLSITNRLKNISLLKRL